MGILARRSGSLPSRDMAICITGVVLDQTSGSATCPTHLVLCSAARCVERYVFSGWDAGALGCVASAIDLGFVRRRCFVFDLYGSPFSIDVNRWRTYFKRLAQARPGVDGGSVGLLCVQGVTV